MKYREPVFVNTGKISLRAKLIETQKRIAKVKAQLYNSEGKMCTEADISYFIFPENIVRDKFHYPGIDAFFEKE